MGQVSPLIMLAGGYAAMSLVLYGAAIHWHSNNMMLMLASCSIICTCLAVAAVPAAARLRDDATTCVDQQGCARALMLDDSDVFTFNVSVASAYIVWCVLAAATFLYVAASLHVLSTLVNFIFKRALLTLEPVFHILMTHPLLVVQAMLSGLLLMLGGLNATVALARVAGSANARAVTFSRVQFLFSVSTGFVPIALICGTALALVR